MPEHTKNEPLASRMRPRDLSHYYGQEHILAKGSMLRRMIEADMLSSIILYGPPGTGKTSLAAVIAGTTKAEMVQVNATTGSKKDLEAAVKNAKAAMDDAGKRTVLFIDEIHRFNKAQQDFLLPFVESGIVTLIGATTENPYFEVNPALVSRSTIFELLHLSQENIRDMLMDAVNYLNSPECTDIPGCDPDLDALEYMAEMAAGDARHAYNSLELAVRTTPPDQATGKAHITLDVARQCMQKKPMLYDKDGDMHYDVISAFIKSMRGSDPDAVLYYLARMLAAGEDPKFICRRIMIHACEDVGLADPMAIVVATACSLAVERIGLPEAQIIMSEAALYVAKAPKSNSACASIGRAMELMRFAADLDIPACLRDAHYKGAKKLNRGIGYKYPHDYPGAWVEQDYLPEKLKGTQLYMGTPNDVPTYRGKA